MKIQTKIKPLLTIALSLALVNLLSPAKVFGDDSVDACVTNCMKKTGANSENCKNNCTQNNGAWQSGTNKSQQSSDEGNQKKLDSFVDDLQPTKPANDAKQNPPEAK